MNSFLLDATTATTVIVATAILLWLRDRNRCASVFMIPNSPDSLHLFAWDRVGSSGQRQNLCRRSADGRVIWKADLPSKNGRSFDAYVSARIQNSVVVAHTFSGFRVTLDLASGRMVQALLTK